LIGFSVSFVLLNGLLFLFVVVFYCPGCEFKQSTCEDNGYSVTLVTEARLAGIRSYRLMVVDGAGLGQKASYKLSGFDFTESSNELKKGSWFVYVPALDSRDGIFEYRTKYGRNLTFPGISEECFNLVRDYARRTRIPSAFVNLGDHTSAFD